MDHEKGKKTCQNQKIGQVTLHIPLSKPCWCRWRVSIQRSYRAPDQPCKPSRRLYLGCHLKNMNTSQMFHRNSRCLPCLKSHETWEVLWCDHLKSSILGYKKSLEKSRIIFQRSLPVTQQKSSPEFTKHGFSTRFTYVPSILILGPHGTPVHPLHLFQTHVKTARIPKPSHPHPGFLATNPTCQVAQTFTLSGNAEEVFHQILLRHLKLSAREEESVNPVVFLGVGWW